MHFIIGQIKTRGRVTVRWWN